MWMNISLIMDIDITNKDIIITLSICNISENSFRNIFISSKENLGGR